MNFTQAIAPFNKLSVSAIANSLSASYKRSLFVSSFKEIPQKIYTV
ncbi:MAG: hypothetical protein V7L01_14005 [Nostoc sp.]